MWVFLIKTRKMTTEYCNKCITTAMDQVANVVDTAVLECVFSLNRAKIKAGMAIQHLRSTNPVVNFICNVVELCNSAISRIYNWVCYNRNEPTQDSWISSYSYNRLKNQSHEEYHVFDNESLQNWPSTEFQEMFGDKYREFSEIQKWSESIVLAKICPELVRIKRSANAKPEEDVASMQVSNTTFLSVTYCVKDVGKLHIDIPKSHYVIGNELLSIGYVTRYLDYLPIYTNWYFDGEYVLYIIDDNLNKIEINHRQWIRLTESGYEIESIQKPASASPDIGSDSDSDSELDDQKEALDDSSSDEEEEEDPDTVLVGLLSSKPKID